jgi:8-oxo-dGTP diphosphatase
MVLATARNGDEFIGYYNGIAPKDFLTTPLTFSCVVTRHQGKVLFVFNPWRKEWELPAGGIEPGETARDAGLRELREESGQTPATLNYAGLILLRLKKNNEFKAGVLYSAEIEQIQPFEANGKSAKIMFWDFQSEVAEYVNEISIALAKIDEPGKAI